jgi:hypothetical protein
VVGAAMRLGGGELVYTKKNETVSLGSTVPWGRARASFCCGRRCRNSVSIGRLRTPTSCANVARPPLILFFFVRPACVVVRSGPARFRDSLDKTTHVC